MNIVRENIDNLSATLKVTVTPEDYAQIVDTSLKNYKKKANVPGFRPGMVPMGIVNKMYKKGVMAEESYKIASQACFDYINENKINAIGDLMPSEHQAELDFDNETDFEFAFEIGIAPEVNVELTKKDTVNKYVINVSDEMRTGYKSNYTRRFGKLVDVDVVTKDEAVNVTLDQPEMQIEDAYVGLVSMSDDERKPFIGKKVGDTMEVNVNELYKTPSQRASIMQIKESELDAINPIFNLTITKIRKFEEPKIDEEFFKMSFPEGEIKNEKEFNEWIEKQIENELAKETEFKFVADTRDFLIKKANLELPKEFLKKWLFNINDGKFSMEEIEKDFESFLDIMRWDLIKKFFVTKHEIAVTNEEMLAEAKALTMMQFAQYGMSTLPDDMLENYAKSILENKEEARKIYDKLTETKVVDAVAPQITAKDTKISVEDFGKLFDQKA